MALIPLHLGQDGITLHAISGVSACVDDGASHQNQDRIPEFVTTDHTSFMTFLQAYYEWMETEGNPKYESLKMLDRRDVDDTVDDFVKYFSREFIQNFPEVFASANTDKRKLIKNIKDFYEAKGTEKSYKLLFRLLFDETPEFKYPSNEIIKASNANWKEPLVLKLSKTNDISDIFGMLGRKLEQRHPWSNEVLAYGFIENILTYHKEGYGVIEVELSSIFGDFESEKEVQLTLSSGTTIYEYVYPTVANIGVSSGASGSNYSVGDQITVSGSSMGVGALGEITAVGLSGEINRVELLNTGINYRSIEDLTATISSNGGTGSGATLGITGGGNIQRKKGYWSGNEGLLSSTNKLQDNDYYQAFSYVIKSSKNLKDYADTVKRIIHPAGFKLFGNTLLSEIMTAGGTLSPTLKKYEVPLSGHYTPYRFITERNLRANGTGGSGGTDLYPDGYGWSAGATGFIVGETASVVHAVVGGSGPLGGVTHRSESIGSGASHGTADSQGPGGTFNGPQGNQWNVVGGLWGASAMSSGETGYGSTLEGAGYWEIYCHPNSRNITSIPNKKGLTTDRLFLTSVEGDLNALGACVGQFDVGEYIIQKNPYSQLAVGKIGAVDVVGGMFYVDVNTISGVFLPYDQDMIGGSVGLATGKSWGKTGYINSIGHNVGSTTNYNEMNYITIQDFLFGIER